MVINKETPTPMLRVWSVRPVRENVDRVTVVCFCHLLRSNLFKYPVVARFDYSSLDRSACGREYWVGSNFWGVSWGRSRVVLDGTE